MASQHDTGSSRDKIEYALGLLTTLLRNQPVHQELVDVAYRMDLPDELWLAVQILSMSEPDQVKLRDFLLVNPSPQLQRLLQIGKLRIGQRNLSLSIQTLLVEAEVGIGWKKLSPHCLPSGMMLPHWRD